MRMAVLVDRGHDSLDRRGPAEGTAAPVDVRAELVLELAHVAGDGVDGEVAQRAQRLAEHALSDRAEQVEIGVGGLARLDLLEQLHLPARPLPARSALAAGLVHVELRGPQSE